MADLVTVCCDPTWTYSLRWLCLLRSLGVGHVRHDIGCQFAHDVGRPVIDHAGLGIAAVIEVDPGVPVVRREDKADADRIVVRVRLRGRVVAPRCRVGDAGVPARLRVDRDLRRLAVPLLSAPAYPLGLRCKTAGICASAITTHRPTPGS